MPDLTLSFTKPSLLDDCSLHRCVRINRYAVRYRCCCLLAMVCSSSFCLLVCAARAGHFFCAAGWQLQIGDVSVRANARAWGCSWLVHMSRSFCSVNGIQQIPIYVKPTVTYKAGSGKVYIQVNQFASFCGVLFHHAVFSLVAFGLD
jgi:hypothetical protein